MASEKQFRANRRNALRSTGPRTASGKAVSRLNALKHGVLAEDIVLPSEDAEVFASLKSGVYDELQPIGEVENLLVDIVVGNAWRLRRIVRVEKGIFIRKVYGQIAADARHQASQHVTEFDSSLARDFALVEAGYGETVVIDDEEAHQAALKRVEEAELVRDGADGTLGQAFIADAAQADALSKLSRYEAHLQRTMFKALSELERLQAARVGSEATAEGTLQVRPELERKTKNEHA
jgi:hypothetical protein